jgi:hypothetical protein
MGEIKPAGEGGRPRMGEGTYAGGEGEVARVGVAAEVVDAEEEVFFTGVE